MGVNLIFFCGRIDGLDKQYIYTGDLLAGGCNK